MFKETEHNSRKHTHKLENSIIYTHFFTLSHFSPGLGLLFFRLAAMAEPDQLQRMYIRNIPLHWSGSDLQRWVVRNQCAVPVNTFVNPRQNASQDMASGFVTWQCSTSDFQRFLIASSNHLLVASRPDRPTIAKRADDRPGSRHQPVVTGYGQRPSGVTSAAAGPRFVQYGGAKRDAPDVTWLQEGLGLLF